MGILLVAGNSLLCKSPFLTDSLIILTLLLAVQLVTLVATLVTDQVITAEVICLFAAKGNKSRLKGRNVNTKSTIAFHLLMMQMGAAFSTKQVKDLETVHTGIWQKIKDIRDIDIYYKEVYQSKAGIDTLFVNTAGAGATAAPKVLPPKIQEAAKDHQAAPDQEPAVRDPLQKNWCMTGTNTKRI